MLLHFCLTNKLQSTSSFLLHCGQICSVPGLNASRQGVSNSQFIFLDSLLSRREQLRWALRCISMKKQKQKCSWATIAILDHRRIITTPQSSACAYTVFCFLLPVVNMSQKDYKALEIEVQCFNPRADALHSPQLDLFANAYSACHIWLLTFRSTSSDTCFFQGCLCTTTSTTWNLYLQFKSGIKPFHDIK